MAGVILLALSLHMAGRQCDLFPMYYQLKFSKLQDKFDGLDPSDFDETDNVLYFVFMML
jgi:hypothetical protein